MNGKGWSHTLFLCKLTCFLFRARHAVYDVSRAHKGLRSR